MKPARIALYGTAIGVIGWSAYIVVARHEAGAALVAAAAKASSRDGRAFPGPAGAASAPTVVASASAVASVESALPRRAKLASEPGGDSFGARQWLPPPPPPPPPPKVVQAPPSPPAPPPPPPPPTLPYKLVGLMDAGTGAKPQVFLSLQDRLLVASPGDVLDGGFRLDAINARELSFTHLASNVTLRMSVTGAPS